MKELSSEARMGLLGQERCFGQREYMWNTWDKNKTYFEASRQVRLELGEPEWSYEVAGVEGSSVILYRPGRDCFLFPVVTRRLSQGVRQRCEVFVGGTKDLWGIDLVIVLNNTDRLEFLMILYDCLNSREYFLSWQNYLSVCVWYNSLLFFAHLL